MDTLNNNLLNTNTTSGLNDEEVSLRQKQFGKNKFEDKKNAFFLSWQSSKTAILEDWALKNSIKPYPNMKYRKKVCSVL